MKLTLHIVEGEKCADALAELGLVSTTSQGGSGRASETDWGPAARFGRVIIWQDVDADDAKSGVNPGVRYAQTVAQCIVAAAEQPGEPPLAGQKGGMSAPPEILIVDLSAQALVNCAGDEELARYGLGIGEDVFDLIQRLKDGRQECLPHQLREELERIAMKFGKRWLRRVEIAYPGQPAPYVTEKHTRESRRPEIRNFVMV